MFVAKPSKSAIKEVPGFQEECGALGFDFAGKKEGHEAWTGV
jgi:hypothetical protein